MNLFIDSLTSETWLWDSKIGHVVLITNLLIVLLTVNPLLSSCLQLTAHESR